jgi:FAD synthetase
MKKVLIFGVFDGVHEGHRALFKQAKKHGEYLVVAVAQDHIVERLKSRLPQNDLPARIDALKKEKLIDEVVLGDAEMGSYDVLIRHTPHAVVLGYDQQELQRDIESRFKGLHRKFQIIIADPHEPGKLHSRLLNKK